ncbi:MAG: hypothetical protein GEV28_20385 [Actinophytocola sp.]|uniref:hypothetical protein n=1 Tax=Actinophytocola sp. TaxID=1872138 RepID=UPI001320CFA4|nr:hypothetical protein [Actinophytocola sp.]MPZ82624.1 hypothetical protein [Actinophytocola sp.]
MATVRPARIVPWVSGAVYAIVLLAGLYYVVAGLGEYRPLRTVGFCAGIAALFGLEYLERRRDRAPRVAAVFLLARLPLFFAVVALDESSLSPAQTSAQRPHQRPAGAGPARVVQPADRVRACPQEVTDSGRAVGVDDPAVPGDEAFDVRGVADPLDPSPARRQAGRAR